MHQKKSEWADVVWYKNTLGENVIDVIFNLEDLKNKISFKDVVYGTKYGGTTIRLPFGFVQCIVQQKIPGEMQFHHDYSKLRGIVDEFLGDFKK